MQGWVLRSARPVNPVILVLFTPNCINIVIPKSKKQINVSNQLIVAMQFKVSVNENFSTLLDFVFLGFLA